MFRFASHGPCVVRMPPRREARHWLLARLDDGYCCSEGLWHPIARQLLPVYEASRGYPSGGSYGNLQAEAWRLASKSWVGSRRGGQDIAVRRRRDITPQPDVKPMATPSARSMCNYLHYPLRLPRCITSLRTKISYFCTNYHPTLL